MDVYHDGSIRGNGKRGIRLTELPIRQTFLWEEQEIYIPAVYVGKAGAVLDVCAKIPVEDMEAFLKKWDKNRRLSLRTPEEYEQIEADNPGSRDFTVEMRLDDTPLMRRVSSSLNWYPECVFRMGNETPAKTEEWENDETAEKLMKAYGCDREYCWHFGRLSYNWNRESIRSPQKVSLTFQANLIPVTAGYFTTSPSCNGETVKATHPVTGQEYTLTLHGCEQTRHSFADIGRKGVIYPEYCQALSYSISPEIARDLFDVRDCAQGDAPRMTDTQKKSSESNCATAVFMAGKSAIPESRAAVSSMHFEPVSEVRWRMVFQIKTRADMEILLPIQNIKIDKY